MQPTSATWGGSAVTRRCEGGSEQCSKVDKQKNFVSPTPGTFVNLETFLVVTTGWAVDLLLASGGKHPTLHRTDPPRRTVIQPQMSVVLRLRTPEVTGVGGQECFNSLGQETRWWGGGLNSGRGRLWQRSGMVRAVGCADVLSI